MMWKVSLVLNMQQCSLGFIFHFIVLRLQKTLTLYICIHNRENKLRKKAEKKANTAACTHKIIDPTEAPASKIISNRTFPEKITLEQLHYLFLKKKNQA